MLFCWVGALSLQVPSLSRRQCSLSLCSHVTAAKIGIFSRKAMFLCDMNIISGVELCIRRKLLLSDLSFQLFISYLLGLDLKQGPTNITKRSFRALSRERKAVIGIIAADIPGGLYCKGGKLTAIPLTPWVAAPGPAVQSRAAAGGHCPCQGTQSHSSLYGESFPAWLFYSKSNFLP